MRSVPLRYGEKRAVDVRKYFWHDPREGRFLGSLSLSSPLFSLSLSSQFWNKDFCARLDVVHAVPNVWMEGICVRPLRPKFLLLR